MPGFEKVAINTAASVAEWMGFPAERVEDLKTVVAEACGNAIEHGNRFNRALWVALTVRLGADALEVLVNDRGQGVKGFAVPGIDLKLAGLEPPGAWGYFSLHALMDQVEFTSEPNGGCARFVRNRCRRE